MTKYSYISKGYTVLLEGKYVNEVCINLEAKLFTKLTNQSSCDEAWAMGCMLKGEKWIKR